jgi:large subunit ribosomal protein L24
MKTTKPTKQRKRLYHATANKRYRLFSAPLSSKLKESHGTNSVPVIKGDTVMVMRGDRKGSEGKVSQIDRKKYRLFIEGATREKVDGTTISVPIHPSKVMITRLNLNDKWRKKTIERKGVLAKTEIAKKKTPKKEVRKKKKTSKVTKESGGT